MMTLISWSIYRSFEYLSISQVDSIAKHKPDVVALQDIAEHDHDRNWYAFVRIGLKHIVSSYKLAKDKRALIGLRNRGEMIASRWPIKPMPPEWFSVPWTERILSAIVHTPAADLILHSVSIPWQNGEEMIKVRILEGIYEYFRDADIGSRILCGNFNSPREETPEGGLITWAQKRRKNGEVTLVKGRGVRWDLAVRNILLGLERFGMRDVFHNLHGPGNKDFCCYHVKRGELIGRRFDHVFSSLSLSPVEVSYLHDVRERSLSSHSAIKVVFSFKG